MGLTLGLMARAPVPGRCKTRLTPPLSSRAAAALYGAMLEDSFVAYVNVRASRLVVLAAPENDGLAVLRQLAPPAWEVVAQEGEGLGARLTHAFTTLGGDGDAVALVGSDSPTVPIAPIARGLAGLEGHDRALVGPCDDGGYYLIALGAVNPRSLMILSGIPWSTPRVLEATRARCAEIGLELAELPSWYDVDDEETLARLRGELGRDPARAPQTAAWLQAADEAKASSSR